MVDREVDVPVWVVLGRSCGLCWRSWAALGAHVGGLGPLMVTCWKSWGILGPYVGGPGPLLGPLLEVLGRSCGLCWRSWAALGPLRAVLGRLGAYVGGLGPLLGLCGRSWAALGAYLGGLGLLLGPLRAVLGRSWDLSWRSWAALGADVGGLGPKNVKNMATLKMCLFLERERDLRPRGRSWVALGVSVCWPGGSKAEKWPWPRREGDLACGSEPKSGPNPSGKPI